MGNSINDFLKQHGLISQAEMQDQSQISPQTQMGNLGGAGYMSPQMQPGASTPVQSGTQDTSAPPWMQLFKNPQNVRQ